jgi:hypothetical protein
VSPGLDLPVAMLIGERIAKCPIVHPKSLAFGLVVSGEWPPQMLFVDMIEMLPRKYPVGVVDMANKDLNLLSSFQ